MYSNPMSTRSSSRQADTASRPLYLIILAGGAVLASLLTVLYQKTLEPISSRGVALLQTPVSCPASVRGETTNERKQLFVSCAGFLD